MGQNSVVRSILGNSRTVDSPLLNRFGVQAARSAAAHIARHARRTSLTISDPDIRAAVKTLRTEGCVVLEDFLSPEQFTAVCDAVERIEADTAVPFNLFDSGSVELQVRWRNDLPEAEREILDVFWCHPTILALGGAAERLHLEPGAGRCTVQHLSQREGDGDIEAVVHSDIFFPTHKVWLYLTDVHPEDGALTFYPRSHRLSLRSLRSTYRESNGDNKGARRIPKDELDALGLERREFMSRRNTVVIANTHGYHGRVQGTPGGRRVALNIELRSTPFRRQARMGVDSTRAGQ